MTLIALDVDGTVLTETGELLDDVIAEVTRVAAAGHQVMIATGRGVSMTLPVIERLGIAPEYLVCANGAITLRRDPDAPTGYVRHWVETFDPTEALQLIRPYLDDAHYLVENERGEQLYVGEVAELALDPGSRRVEFDELLHIRATRVVVVSPGRTSEEFIELAERIGLDSVSYNVGWAAWLDLAPEGITKASALERVRRELGIGRDDVIAIGDGRNDIEMLEWAGAHGRGIAMAQAPEEVLAVASEVTACVAEAGVARVLRGL